MYYAKTGVNKPRALLRHRGRHDPVKVQLYEGDKIVFKNVLNSYCKTPGCVLLLDIYE